MGVAQGIHTQARNKIEIALPFQVIEEDALAMAERNGIAVISRQQKLPLTFGDLFKGSHNKI
jgi:hypothetical protein